MTCNTCEECTPSCNECCNPNIIWDWCVSVDTSEEWVITISTPCPPRVISSDWSIKVTAKESTKTWYSIDYDVAINKEDQYVKACSWDTTPWTLNEKLKVSWALTKSSVWCTGSNAYIEIWIDESALDVPNNKVAVSAWCSPDYLYNVLRTDSDNFTFEKSWCSLVLKDKNQQEVFGKITLMWTVHHRIPRWKPWELYGIWNTDLQAMGFKDILIPWTFKQEIMSWMWMLWWWLLVKKTWVYEVGFSGSVEASFWVHGLRVQLLKVNLNQSWNYHILESRFAAPVWLKPMDAKKGNDENYNGQYINEWTEWAWYMSWLSASLWTSLQRMDFWKSIIAQLYEWDILFLWFKWQSDVEYKAWVIQWDDDWDIAILWTESDVWAQIYAHMITSWNFA